MIFGFTGTSRGITGIQVKRLHELLLVELFDELDELHHGDCIGGDERCHRLVQLYKPSCRIVVHPGDVPHLKRAFCRADEILPVKPPLERNHDIAAIGELLVACPKEGYEVLRSGTWATIRYARKLGRDTIIIFPDGKVRKILHAKGEAP